MLDHPDQCSCFCCVYEAEAIRRIEAGLLDRMDLILGLMQILARTINSHPSPEQRARRVAFFVNYLYQAAALPLPRKPSLEATGEAETSPRRPN